MNNVWCAPGVRKNRWGLWKKSCTATGCRKWLLLSLHKYTGIRKIKLVHRDHPVENCGGTCNFEYEQYDYRAMILHSISGKHWVCYFVCVYCVRWGKLCRLDGQLSIEPLRRYMLNLVNFVTATFIWKQQSSTYFVSIYTDYNFHLQFVTVNG